MKQPIAEIEGKPFSARVRSSNGISYYHVDLDYYPSSKKPFSWRCTCKDMARCWENQRLYPGPVQLYLNRGGLNPKRHMCKHVYKFFMYRFLGFIKARANEQHTEENNHA